jgi:hypothetical protein
VCRGAYNERANENSVPYRNHQAARRCATFPPLVIRAGRECAGWKHRRLGGDAAIFAPKNSITGLRHAGLVAGDYELLTL